MRLLNGTMSTRGLRRAFTLVEMLVVISIIALLAAITAGAAYRLKQSQDRSFTETTLAKLASALDGHWKATIDAARKEYDSLPIDVRNNLLALADNDTPPPSGFPKPHPRRDDRARLLYVKFRLQQEFPVSFGHAVYPDKATHQASPAQTVYFLKPSTVPGISGQFTGKPAYVKAFYGYTTTPPTPPTLKVPPINVQSSAVLLMALEQGRGSAGAVSIEQMVGSQFVRTDADSGVRYLVDSWGAPLRFYTFPTGAFFDGTDLTGNDPQDPEGLLQDNAVNRWRPPAAASFATLLHPIVANRRLVPTIVSAGQDGLLGGVEPPTLPLGPFMNLAAAGSEDNIYSYRLRQGSTRGD